MQDVFNSHTGRQQDLSEAERFLKSVGADYGYHRTGRLVVPNGLHIDKAGLTELPDLSGVLVGSFNCSGNKLTSLKGAPHIFNGSFNCSDNLLLSLDGSPGSVAGHFLCEGNGLISIAGGPRHVSGNFLCSRNPLAPQALRHAPESFKYFCSDLGKFRGSEQLAEYLARQDAATEQFIASGLPLQETIHVSRPLLLKKRP
jgi:hypothetical protein